MTDTEIKTLREILSYHKRQLIFTFDNTDFQRVNYIANHPDEPGPVAWLNNGGYVALYNCELSQFGILQKLGENYVRATP
jgi:hypothetical protein